MYVYIYGDFQNPDASGSYLLFSWKNVLLIPRDFNKGFFILVVEVPRAVLCFQFGGVDHTQRAEPCSAPISVPFHLLFSPRKDLRNYASIPSVFLLPPFQVTSPQKWGVLGLQRCRLLGNSWLGRPLFYVISCWIKMWFCLGPFLFS